ncbi:dipeptidase 1-like isoform X2 [Zootermopsis nevadensis]|nr:dipeptidase 1-like isoform X2 [Zootermopsis nevadensis]XP_021940412.1 dipeptidase 1-like isoform X2 [Zootermopsis nevadensis]XP_021940414.1 dipeptidase 1-like isoform X2 [Zootermopsis nevadensis]
MGKRLKHWCLGVVVCLLFSALGVGLGVPLALSAAGPSTHQERLEAVRRILRDVPLIDGHNDLPWNVRKFVHNQILSFNFTADLEKVDPWARSNWSHTDLPRLRRGMVGAQFWSAYVPCDAQYLDAVQLTLEQIDLIKRLADLNPEHLTLVTSVKGVQETHRAGRIASLIGVEGGHSLGNSLAVLRTFYSLGARYMTVTHTCNTAWADCSVTQLQSESSPSTASPVDHNKGGGLTEFGKLVVREMNRLGMMVDLSHASVRTMKDALAVSKAPVMFSHSSAFALCNSSRNVPDDVLKLVALNGGIVMVNFYTYFITCNSTATITDVIAHINHIRDVAGINHVGIGAGYDGINFTPQGLEDVSKYPQLMATLLEDPSWREEDLKKLAGLNLLRVFRAVEEVREKWQLAAVMPVEELIPASYLEGHTDCMYLGS